MYCLDTNLDMFFSKEFSAVMCMNISNCAGIARG